MLKKGLFVLVLAVLVAGGVFAQNTAHKYEPVDMLLGINFGFGVTPNIGNLISPDTLKKGNYAVVVDLGLTYDFYLFNWLSVSTGLFAHPDIYVIADQDMDDFDEITDIAAAPICLTIPLMAHVNIPKAEWLYVGVGVNLNIPISSILKSVDIDAKGDFFVGLPIDIGFDFVKPNRGGGRFFFRVTPEFHKKGVALPIGFIWQVYNWRIYSKD